MGGERGGTQMWGLGVEMQCRGQGKGLTHSLNVAAISHGDVHSATWVHCEVLHKAYKNKIKYAFQHGQDACRILALKGRLF